MAKAAEHGLRLTPGSFTMSGIVSGVKKPTFYSEKDFGSTKMRSANFGVKYDDNKTLFPTVQGFTRASVYFSRKNSTTGKNETKQVSWADRLTFAENNPDWKIIGCNIGLKKDEEGKNIKQYLTEYDAAKYIKENLNDGVTVFVRGNLDFSSYVKGGEVHRKINYNATQVSLSADVDFTAEGYKPIHNWTQEVVYTGIEKETDADGKHTGRFVMSGYVVSYNAIEPVSFIVTSSKDANNLRKNMKPYQSINVDGVTEVVHAIEDVAEVDDWGNPIPAHKRANNPSIREMIVTYLDPSTIDSDSFSEKAIAAGIKKLKDKENVAKNFGEKREEEKVEEATDDGWGDSSSADDDDTPW
jgi:hypothetical protein